MPKRSALLLLLFSSCAKVGDPQPPLSRPWPPPQDLSLVQTGRQIELRFSLPSYPVERVEVYRSCEGGSLPAQELRWERVARLRPEELGRSDADERRSYRDELSQPNCLYSIRFLALQGGRSPLGNSVRTLPPEQIPAAPEDLRAQVFPDRIELTWRPAPSPPFPIDGYLINGRTTVPEPRFEDPSPRFGQETAYRVQAFREVAGTLALSPPAEIRLTPEDRFPPSPPTQLRAVQVGSHVQLLWKASPEPDVKAYVVFRGEELGSLAKLAASVTINSYTDEKVNAGATYYYRVSAVDRAGNESEPSEIVRIRVNP